MQHLTEQEVKRLDEIKGLNKSIEQLLDTCYKTMNNSLCDFFSDEYEKAEALQYKLNNQRQSLRHEMLSIIGF